MIFDCISCVIFRLRNRLAPFASASKRSISAQPRLCKSRSQLFIGRDFSHWKQSRGKLILMASGFLLFQANGCHFVNRLVEYVCIPLPSAKAYNLEKRAKGGDNLNLELQGLPVMFSRYRHNKGKKVFVEKCSQFGFPGTSTSPQPADILQEENKKNFTTNTRS